MIIGYYYLSFENNEPDYFKAVILGLVMFGVYDFTNYATIKDYDPKIFSIDIAWGIFLSVTSLFITDFIYKKIEI